MKRPQMSYAFNALTGYGKKNPKVVIVDEKDVFKYGRVLDRVPELMMSSFKGYPAVPGESTMCGDRLYKYSESLDCLVEDTAFHYHDFDEVVRIREGKGTVFIGPRTDAKINNVLYPGDVITADIHEKIMIGIPRGWTHGFHVPKSLTLESVYATSVYSENRMKFKIDKEAEDNMHRFFLSNRLRINP